MEHETPKEIAVALGISPKTFRAWLRAEKDAGHPVLAGRAHNGSWTFVRAEADLLAAEYRASGGRARAPGQRYRPATGSRRPWAKPPAAAPAPTAPLSPGRPSGRLPPLPESFTRPGLEAVGFEGWITWDAVRAAGLREVPSVPGVYVVLRAATGKPKFVHPGTGGRFKGRDPNEPEDGCGPSGFPGRRSSTSARPPPGPAVARPTRCASASVSSAASAPAPRSATGVAG